MLSFRHYYYSADREFWQEFLRKDSVLSLKHTTYSRYHDTCYYSWHYDESAFSEDNLNICPNSYKMQQILHRVYGEDQPFSLHSRRRWPSDDPIPKTVLTYGHNDL